MKILLFNGSPRKGNTAFALEAVKKGLGNLRDVEVKVINAADVSVAPCMACEQCGCEGECVFDDDTNDVVSAVMEADVIIFATPVYWWGITAQLKVIIDKFYCRDSQLPEMNKKIGFVVIGAAEQEDPQYEIIAKQFECICDYLGWELVFGKTYSASSPDELADSKDAAAELESLWEVFK